MSWLSKGIRKLTKNIRKIDPVFNKMVDIEKKLPGSMGAAVTALEGEGVSNNPYKRGEASRWDIFAGGTELSKKEKNRDIGRIAGTAAAIWFGAGALGAGSGGGTTGAATTGTAAKSAGIMGTGVTAGEAAVAAGTLYATAEQKKAAEDAERAMAEQNRTISESTDRLIDDANKRKTPTIDEARRRSEQSDSMRRRRGRRASILTGDTGVGYTPISQRSLIGT